MKKLKSTLPNMVVVLTCVALITGGLLAWVHHITEAPKLAEQQRSLAADISKVMGGKSVKETDVKNITKEFDGKTYNFVVHYVADANGSPLGKAVESTTMGFGGDLHCPGRPRPTGQGARLCHPTDRRDSGLGHQGCRVVPEGRQGQHHRQGPYGQRLCRA